MNTHSKIKPLTVNQYKYITIYFKAKQNLIRINTKLNWYDKHMTTDGQYKSTAPLDNYEALNAIIIKTKQEVDSYLMYNANNTRVVPNQADCVAFINRHSTPLTEISYKGMYVCEAFQNFIDTRRNTRSATNGTLLNMGFVLKRLEKYEATLSKKLTFNDINLTFSENFTGYLYKEGLMSGTIDKTLAILKTMLQYYIERPESNIVINPAYKLKAFNTCQKSKNLPKPIERQEFNKLLTFDFKDQQMNMIRDMFLLACTTGLRYVDLFTITPEMIISDCLVISPSKTLRKKGEVRNLLTINLNDISRNIILKHSNNTKQYFMSANHYRTLLTKMCKAASINLYSSHSCRDTFITYAVEANISIPILMAWTGHTKYEDLARYIKVNEQQKVNEMQNITCFKLTA